MVCKQSAEPPPPPPEEFLEAGALVCQLASKFEKFAGPAIWELDRCQDVPVAWNTFTFTSRPAALWEARMELTWPN